MRVVTGIALVAGVRGIAAAVAVGIEGDPGRRVPAGDAAGVDGGLRHGVDAESPRRRRPVAVEAELALRGRVRQRVDGDRVETVLPKDAVEVGAVLGVAGAAGESGSVLIVERRVEGAGVAVAVQRVIGVLRRRLHPAAHHGAGGRHCLVVAEETVGDPRRRRPVLLGGRGAGSSGPPASGSQVEWQRSQMSVAVVSGCRRAVERGRRPRPDPRGDVPAAVLVFEVDQEVPLDVAARWLRNEPGARPGMRRVAGRADGGQSA